MIIGTQNYFALLDKLLVECHELPPSTRESPMLYNYNKLMNILQKKEIFGLVQNQETIDKAHMLSGKFAGITRSIVTGSGSGEEPLAAYNDLELQIEESLTGSMYIFAKQWGLSVKALYHYKHKNYDKAFDYSLECVILNEYLIREGIFTLLFRSAEQNKNITRILFRSGNWEAGAASAKDLLNYLLNGEPGALHGEVFEEKRYWNEMPYVREGYAYECFRAMVSLVIHLEKGNLPNVPDLFPQVFGDLTFDVNTPDRQILHNWIYIKTLFQSGSYENFLVEFLDFMNDPKSKVYDILKIDLFLDIVKLLKKGEQYPNEEALLREINSFLETHLDVHEYLKKDLSATNLVVLDAGQ